MDENAVVRKSAEVSAQALDDTELAAINKYALRKLTAEEVFTFKAILCDNEIDRDSEVFPLASLAKLAKLFVGKTVISDHSARAANQCARIYATEVQTGGGTAKTGEPYNRLVAHCYMVRTEANKDLIVEIEAGIKKEVSVGCRCAKAVCSICGTDNRKKWCEHFPGRQYEGKTCHFALEAPTDAYEISFVAVPAQPKAGTTKSYGANPPEQGTPDDTGNVPDVVKALIDLRIRTGEMLTECEKEAH